MSRTLSRSRIACATVLAVLVTLFAWLPPSLAVTAPRTLADRQPVQAGPVVTDFAIDYVGVLWDTERGQGHGHDAGADVGDAAGDGGAGGTPAAVRLRHDGVWGSWIPLVEDGVESRGRWASGLVHGDGAEAYQVRGVPPSALDARAVAINTTDGPAEKVGTRRGGAADAAAVTSCVTRAGWGADESLRLDAAGKEIFPPAFYPAQALTVHHTATRNGDPDPAGTVRAIYRYHTVDNGWGDIGYQYLVDGAGVIYEGRWSGEESTSCADIAHEAGTDAVVTGAHTGGWNSGNVGIALLGEFTTSRRSGAEPSTAAVASLEDLLADLSVRHGLDPSAQTTYVNPVSGEQRVVETIGGHRDYQSTECPGERLYALLPGIREAVAARTGGGPVEEAQGWLHVSDLDGHAVPGRNRWEAQVTVTVRDEQLAPVGSAVVTGTWTGAGSGATCTTGADGTCTVGLAAHRRADSVTFTVDDVGRPAYSYAPAQNGDPDGDSDGTTITVVAGG